MRVTQRRITLGAQALISELSALLGRSRSVIVPAAISAANPTVSDSVGWGWMVSADVLCVGAHLERVGGLGDQFAGVDADDAGAEDAPRSRARTAAW